MTATQVAFLVGYLYVLVAWLYSELLRYFRSRIEKHPRDVEEVGGDGDRSGAPTTSNGSHKPEFEAELATLLGRPSTPSRPLQPGLWPTALDTLIRFLLMNDTFLHEHRLTLRAMAEFGTHMVFFMLTDRTSVLPSGARSYNRDLFLFLYFCLVAASLGGSLKRHYTPSAASPKRMEYLNRHQTEEWKGWMQVLFLMYHYFVAKEMYNAIRIFIAAYVWMTGFGNFSYYYIRRDFGLGRFCQMMWRLNFLVFFCCVVLDNDYMLYYICPMHTLFTLLVYATCRIGSQYNDHSLVIAAKFLVNIALVTIVWEVPGVFDAIWSPFVWMVGYVDPRRPNADRLYEWRFRSGLDRYIWIVGMLYAYTHPLVERLMERVEDMEPRRRLAVRGAAVAVGSALGFFWYANFFTLPKLEYNRLHPYTSWMPITAYLILRNVTPPLRYHTLTLWAWLGKVTLETYICQFHIWLKTSIPNGQPIAVLVIIRDYPMLNLMLCTVLYIFISYRLFHLTNTLKSAFIPAKDNTALYTNVLSGAVAMTALYVLSLALVAVPGQLFGSSPMASP